MKLDIIDLKILRALQANSKITNIELSKVVGLSAAPTLGRVQKLEKLGIISSYHAKVNNGKLGLGFMALVQLSLIRQKSTGLEGEASFFKFDMDKFNKYMPSFSSSGRPINSVIVDS